MRNTPDIVLVVPNVLLSNYQLTYLTRKGQLGRSTVINANRRQNHPIRNRAYSDNFGNSVGTQLQLVRTNMKEPTIKIMGHCPMCGLTFPEGTWIPYTRCICTYAMLELCKCEHLNCDPAMFIVLETPEIRESKGLPEFGEHLDDETLEDKARQFYADYHAKVDANA